VHTDCGTAAWFHGGKVGPKPEPHSSLGHQPHHQATSTKKRKRYDAVEAPTPVTTHHSNGTTTIASQTRTQVERIVDRGNKKPLVQHESNRKFTSRTHRRR